MQELNKERKEEVIEDNLAVIEDNLEVTEDNKEETDHTPRETKEKEDMRVTETHETLNNPDKDLNPEQDLQLKTTHVLIFIKPL